MQIVSSGDSLHEMSNSVYWEKSDKYFRLSFAEIFTKPFQIVICWNFYQTY